MNPQNTQKHLEAIRDATEEILTQAQAHKHEIEGPINWAGLHCCGSRYIMTDDGDEYFEVMIEDADRYNEHLYQFVRERLMALDFDLVYPVFGW